VLNIFEAHEWMWDCDRRTIRDLAFGEFADYMARLVAYYKRRIVRRRGRAHHR
jgi:hypothetical protein